MITADSHMHTWWSTDSEADPMDMCRAAVNARLDTIIITDHHDIGCPAGGFEQDEDTYPQQVRALARRVEGRLRVLTGIELGLQTTQEARIKRFLKDHRSDYDEIIGSTHYILGEDPWEASYWADHPGTEGYVRYYEALVNNIRMFEGFDTVGHLDYPIRYGLRERRPYREADYSDAIDTVLKTLIERGTALECNTAAWPLMGRPNPSDTILFRYRQLGGELITVGGDAHDPDHVAQYFKEASDLLKQIGFTYYAVFEQHRPVMRKL